MAFQPDLSLPTEPDWPDETVAAPGVVVLADASGKLEKRLIRAWIRRHVPFGTTTELFFISPSRRRRSAHQTEPRLAARLTRGDNPWVIPLRVIWMPSVRGGLRTARWSDVLKLGDPRDPDALRARVILWRYPERVRLVVGAGTPAIELITAHAVSVEVMGLADLATRRAHVALDRAEREHRGNRYKIPKFVSADILRRATFRDGVVRIAETAGLTSERGLARAGRYLEEIAATHSPFVIDLLANTIRWVYRQGYGGIAYDAGQVAGIAVLGRQYPVAFLPSHRSNLDRLALQYLLWENDLPPNHTAAGINMNFFPIGPLIRRTGAFFIRRSFKDNELYKFVFRSYLGYLVEKRFPLEWYLEGGRSRSGKLLPPRYGMLAWLVEAVAAGRAEDLYLIPTSIAYDQIQDVDGYAREAGGGDKTPESAGWAVGFIAGLRRRYGNIHVRFADPISVRKELAGIAPDEDSIDLAKLAFEIMYRISRITPVTPTAVVASVLLSAPGTALSAAEISTLAGPIVAYIERMGLPTTESLRLEQPDMVIAVLGQLAGHGSVSTEEGRFHLSTHQALQAAYYRNTVVHYFVPGAIAELALLAADSGTELWGAVYKLRDLLKFEFFFPEREQFAVEIGDELEMIGWVAGTPGRGAELLERAPLLRAHWALASFLDAYQIVADQLVDTEGDVNEKLLLPACLLRGRRYRAEGRVSTDDSLSLVLFKSAWSLAKNRRLDATSDRRRFAAEIQGWRRLTGTVGEIARSTLVNR